MWAYHTMVYIYESERPLNAIALRAHYRFMKPPPRCAERFSFVCLIIRRQFGAVCVGCVITLLNTQLRELCLIRLICAAHVRSESRIKHLPRNNWCWISRLLIPHTNNIECYICLAGAYERRNSSKFGFNCVEEMRPSFSWSSSHCAWNWRKHLVIKNILTKKYFSLILNFLNK